MCHTAPSKGYASLDAVNALRNDLSQLESTLEAYASAALASPSPLRVTFGKRGKRRSHTADSSSDTLDLREQLADLRAQAASTTITGSHSLHLSLKLLRISCMLTRSLRLRKCRKTACRVCYPIRINSSNHCTR